MDTPTTLKDSDAERLLDATMCQLPFVLGPHGAIVVLGQYFETLGTYRIGQPPIGLQFSTGFRSIGKGILEAAPRVRDMPMFSREDQDRDSPIGWWATIRGTFRGICRMVHKLWHAWEYMPENPDRGVELSMGMHDEPALLGRFLHILMQFHFELARRVPLTFKFETQPTRLNGLEVDQLVVLQKPHTHDFRALQFHCLLAKLLTPETRELMSIYADYAAENGYLDYADLYLTRHSPSGLFWMVHAATPEFKPTYGPKGPRKRGVRTPGAYIEPELPMVSLDERIRIALTRPVPKRSQYP